jgi:hypothetical protein
MQYFAVKETDNIGESGTLLFTFERVWVEDAAETELQGKPVGAEVDYIEIAIPGDRDNVVRRPFGSEKWDDRRFGSRYKAWKEAMTGDGMVGTPLVEVPWMRPQLVRELAFYNVKTLENLASLGDGPLSKLGPGYQALRQKAKDKLAEAKASEPFNEIKARLGKSEADNESLRVQLKELLEATKKKDK